MKTVTRLAHGALLACAVALGGASVSTAQAQDVSQFAGQWGCKYSMEPFNGQPLDKHYWEFQLALYPQGQYQMQGFYYNPVVGQVPVQGEGQWGPVQGGIRLTGRLLRQDSGWGPFDMMGQAANGQSLYFQFRGNTHMTNVSCQR